ncbi:hypothetical protein ACFV0C_22275 [Streptomyces sp. NPDC059568]|uniref:hypothetical protein n=1 Tax=Streptomyces sp. NPDC059568 TaxID=3346868 RepID=UPI0036A87D1C
MLNPSPIPAWFDSLTASVHALGAAAREYRTANQSAQASAWHTDPTRLLPINGAVRIPGRDIVRPQHDALWRLGELYGDLRSSTKRLYENTAQAYAHGTAAAVRSVLNGGRPAYIELDRRDGHYVLPVASLPDMQDALSRWTGSRRLATLRHQVIDREHARAVVSDFAFYEDLTDCETADITHASERAAGLADCAYAYGETAESALHFVLLTATTQSKCTAEGDR